ncbi:MAG: hypothetical protein HY709_10235 [Candidatus Latescibacteria bacterium]|nr:hypothetical protein [Candidatus Latescibacterota bacterium]
MIPPDKESIRPGKRYRLVAYLRIDPDNDEPMTYEEALAEQEQHVLLFPENLYRIEELSTEEEENRNV